MTAPTPVDAPAPRPSTAGPGNTSGPETMGAKILRAVLTQRIVLLVILVIAVVSTFMIMSSSGKLSGNYDANFMSDQLINAVPLAMLALAQMIVIMSGRGGIDLSVGAIVSLAGMVFGIAYNDGPGQWNLNFISAMLITVAFGGLCGAVNGVLVAYLRFPALIATLATFYAYKSLAVVINNQKPISKGPVADLYSTSRSVEIPFLGDFLPAIRLGVFTYMIPTIIVVWIIIARTTYGRRLFAIGTNDVAAQWAGINVRDTRMKAYILAGLISGLVAVVTVAQFASARPEAGVSGNGMALPAITIAVLGGVAISGGIGRVSGIVLATLLIVWLNAGLPLAIEGNAGTQYQRLALGVVLVFAALLNGLTTRKYGASK